MGGWTREWETVPLPVLQAVAAREGRHVPDVAQESADRTVANTAMVAAKFSNRVAKYGATPVCQESDSEEKAAFTEVTKLEVAEEGHQKRLLLSPLNRRGRSDLQQGGSLM